MKTARLFVGLLVMALLASCRGKSPAVDSNCLIVKIDESEAQTMKTADWFEGQRLLPLVCPQETVVGHISKIYELNNGDFLLFDDSNNAMMLFGNDGIFKTAIGQKGNAREEYQSWNDCHYDASKDLIYALDRYKHSLYVYDVSGNLQTVTKTAFMANSFTVSNDVFWLYTCFPDANKSKSQLVQTDAALQRASASWFPISDFVEATLAPCFSTDMAGNSYFFYPNDNVVFRLSDGPVPFLKADFGERTLPYGKIRKSSSRECIDIRNSYPYLGYIEEFCVTGNLCRFNISQSPLNKPMRSYQAFVNLKSGECRLYSGVMESFDKVGADYRHLLGQTRAGEWIFSTDPSSVFPFELQTLQTQFPTLSSDDNPVLVFCKLR